MVACDLSTRPSKPRVGGSNPSERAALPSIAEGDSFRKTSEECGTSPHSVPTGGSPKLKGRTGTRKDLRAGVCKRADGYCESCRAWVGLNGEDGHLDHRFGRGKGRPPESVANCWLLCIACDAERTKPTKTTAAYWWGRFILHAQRYGFTAEADLADTKLGALMAKGLVAP